MTRFPQFFYAFFLLLFLSGCKNDNPDIIVYDVKPFVKKIDDDHKKNPETSKKYHTDTTYEYDYRTGESGKYKYHYNVVGKNSKGENITGEVDMEGKYGVGILDDQTNIEAEWVDKGEIEAKDSKGNIYELIVE